MESCKAAFQTAIQRYEQEQVKLEEIGCETIEMGREEVDPQYVPTAVIDTLPKSFLVTSLNYTTLQGDTYVMIRIWAESIKNYKVQVLLKEDQVLEQTTKVN